MHGIHVFDRNVWFTNCLATVPLKGKVALARHSMLEARKLDTLYSC